MARQIFGAGLADFVVRPSDGLWGVAGGATVTFWDSSDAGTQYTDLLDATNTPVTQIVADEFGQLPSFSGPDGITGMWVDAGGESRAWIQARGGGGGGGGGPFAFTKLIRVVASATAPADVRTASSYVCDGTADQVQIMQAIADAQSDGGGIVMLSVGDFSLTAPVLISGTANEDNPLTVSLVGCGEHASVLKPAINTQAAVVLTNWAQCHLSNFGIEIMGSTSGIVSTSVTTTDTRSFWDSSFRDLRVYGFFDGTYTGWALDLDMPFRSVFQNIEVEGTRKGIHLYNNSPVQNAGDCTFDRMFIEIVGTGGTAIHVESVDGNMNQNNFNMVEAAANGAGCTGILIDGAAGGASQRFWGTNLEQFATLINVANGESNVFDLNYVTCDTGAVGNKAFVFGTTSFNNVVRAAWVNVGIGDGLVLIDDQNHDDSLPNIFERIRIENNGGNVTWTKYDTSILREITARNDGGTIQAGLLRLPQSEPDPVTLTSARTTTATTLADVTDMVQWLYAGTYHVEIEGMVRTSATTAIPKFALGGTATWGASSAVNLEVGTSPTAVSFTRASAANAESANASISAATTDVLVRVRGTVVVTAAGTLRLRWRAAAAGTLTLQPGSYLRVRKVA